MDGFPKSIRLFLPLSPVPVRTAVTLKEVPPVTTSSSAPLPHLTFQQQGTRTLIDFAPPATVTPNYTDLIQMHCLSCPSKAETLQDPPNGILLSHRLSRDPAEPTLSAQGTRIPSKSSSVSMDNIVVALNLTSTNNNLHNNGPVLAHCSFTTEHQVHIQQTNCRLHSNELSFIPQDLHG